MATSKASKSAPVPPKRISLRLPTIYLSIGVVFFLVAKIISMTLEVREFQRTTGVAVSQLDGLTKLASESYEKGYLQSAWDMYQKTNRYAFSEGADGRIAVWKKEVIDPRFSCKTTPAAPQPASLYSSNSAIPLVSTNADAHAKIPLKLESRH